MLNYIAQSLIAYAGSSIVFFALAGISLNYYVALYSPQQEALKAFLDKLKFPATTVVSFLPTGKSEGAASALLDNSPIWARRLRVVNALILLAILTPFVYGAFLRRGLEEIIPAALDVGYIVTSSFFTWRFGHKLKDFPSNKS